MKRGKRETREATKLPSQESIRTLSEEENYKYLEILKADKIKQIKVKEKRNVPQKSEETARNQFLQKKFHERDKYLDCFPYEILRTILKMD